MRPDLFEVGLHVLLPFGEAAGITTLLATFSGCATIAGVSPDGPGPPTRS